jgi:hypothetical protein
MSPVAASWPGWWRQRIGTLIIGKNDGWKQAIGLGKRTNQNVALAPLRASARC